MSEKAIELTERWILEVDEYRKLGGSHTADGMLATIAFYSHIEPIIAELKAKPPAGDFTKKFREILYRFAPRPEAIDVEVRDKANEACDRLDRQEEGIRYAIGGIDALLPNWSNEEAKKDALAIKKTLEQAQERR